MLSRMGGSLNLRRLKFKAVREYYTTVKESFRSTEYILLLALCRHDDPSRFRSPRWQVR